MESEATQISIRSPEQLRIQKVSASDVDGHTHYLGPLLLTKVNSFNTT